MSVYVKRWLCQTITLLLCGTLWCSAGDDKVSALIAELRDLSVSLRGNTDALARQSYHLVHQALPGMQFCQVTNVLNMEKVQLANVWSSDSWVHHEYLVSTNSTLFSGLPFGLVCVNRFTIVREAGYLCFADY
jgi:hypothetical protein